MTPLFIGGLGVPELLIILAVVLLLFGGARLAGIGKSTGRAIKEFKEETKGIGGSDKNTSDPSSPVATSEAAYQQPAAPRAADAGYQQPSAGSTADPAGGDQRRDA